MKSKFEYILPQHGEKYPEDATEFHLDGVQEGPHHLAKKAARHYHWQGGGWESSWPNTFVIFVNGEWVGAFEVDREAEPVFIPRKIDSEKPAGGAQ